MNESTKWLDMNESKQLTAQEKSMQIKCNLYNRIHGTNLSLTEFWKNVDAGILRIPNTGLTIGSYKYKKRK